MKCFRYRKIDNYFFATITVSHIPFELEVQKKINFFVQLQNDIFVELLRTSFIENDIITTGNAYSVCEMVS